MHITLVSTSFPVTHDGSEAAGSFVADFATALSRRVPTTVVAPAHEAGESVLSDELDLVQFRAPKLPLSLLNPASPPDWSRIVTTLRNGGAATRRVATSRDSDHVLALWALPSGHWAASTDRPFSTWALGSDIWGLGRLPVIRWTLARTLRKAEYNFADGLELAKDVAAISGRACEFLPSSRDLGVVGDAARRVVGSYRFAFLGRWHPNKGVDLLLDALDMLGDRDWRSIERFDIAGGGPLEPLVRERCERLRRARRPVTLQGFLDRDEARDYLLRADFAVIPSRVESIPVVFSDCLQAGCTMIVTPVGDLPALMTDGCLGQLCAEPSGRAIADGIRAALESGLASEAALARAAERFSVEGAVSTFLGTIGF